MTTLHTRDSIEVPTDVKNDGILEIEQKVSSGGADAFVPNPELEKRSVCSQLWHKHRGARLRIRILRKIDLRLIPMVMIMVGPLKKLFAETCIALVLMSTVSLEL